MIPTPFATTRVKLYLAISLASVAACSSDFLTPRTNGLFSSVTSMTYHGVIVVSITLPAGIEPASPVGETGILCISADFVRAANRPPYRSRTAALRQAIQCQLD